MATEGEQDIFFRNLVLQKATHVTVGASPIHRQTALSGLSGFKKREREFIKLGG